MYEYENYTREDILNLVEEEDVGFIRLQFTDIFGTMKNVAITVSQLKRALDNKCMFDGSSIEGFARIEESDMYLHPDLNTFEIFPCGRSRERLQDLSAIFTDRMEQLTKAIRDMFLRRYFPRQKRWDMTLT